MAGKNVETSVIRWCYVLFFLVIGVIAFPFNNQPLKLTYDSLDYLAASESINATSPAKTLITFLTLQIKLF